MESDDEASAKKSRYSSSRQDTDNFFLAKTANSLINEEKYLSVGCPNFDLFLKGGFSNRGITQIYGAAGVGKTQFALQLCLTVQIPVSNGGFGAGAVYISTEGLFPSRRLQQLLNQSEISKKYKITGDAIFVETLTELPELENCITQRLPQLFAARKIGLLILDSVAAPYRAAYSGDEMKIRAKSLWNVGHGLHNLANQYKLTIICINQVSAVVASNNSEALQLASEQPTLGITWANMITNNFYLRREGDRRYFKAMQSSYLPRSGIEFIIKNSGVSGIIKK